MTIKDTVILRDGGCVGRVQLPGACGGELYPHHIINRGMGGSKKYDTPRWLIAMCTIHNVAMETDPDTAKIARHLGMKLSRNGLKPAYAVVHYPDGWYRLEGESRIPDPQPRSRHV